MSAAPFVPKRRTPSPASPPHLLTNAGERYALLGGPMVRSLYWLILAVFPFSICMNITAADSVSAANTTCNFDRNTQIAVDYEQFQLAAGNKAHATPVSYGTVWAPGGKPLTLFTNTPVSVGGEQLADGAYTMFIVPREKSWTLIISTSTDTSGKYDKNDDLARIPMDFGELPRQSPNLVPISRRRQPTSAICAWIWGKIALGSPLNESRASPSYSVLRLAPVKRRTEFRHSSW